MIWIYRNINEGFEDLAQAEMISAGLTQVSNRFFIGNDFNLENSAFASFAIKEISKGSTPEDAIRNIKISIPSPYRVEKIDGKRRQGSITYARLAYKYIGGDIRASNPESILLVFTPDNENWYTGLVIEKQNSILEKMNSITERTCVSLSSLAALAMVNIANSDTIVDPCCGTGLIPIASVLRKKKTFAGDNNHRMIRLARKNRDNIGLDLEILPRDAFKPWVDNCCLVSDFPADRSWMSNITDHSLELFKCWLPYIKSFCVIFPDQIIEKLPKNINIAQKIAFTAGRTIVLGTVDGK